MQFRKWILGVALTAGAAHANLIFNTNVLVNPGAETALSGWTVTSNITTVSWSAGGGFPTNSDPGPPSRGSFFFAGGPNNPLSTGTQSLDISNVAFAIDSGLVAFTLDGFLGGYQSQADFATFSATFEDQLLNVIGSAGIGPVTAGDRGGATGLLQRTTTGNIPVGTRNIVFTLSFTRPGSPEFLGSATYNDGYADNLSFVTVNNAPPGAPVPEPLSVLLIGVALIGIGVRRGSSQILED